MAGSGEAMGFGIQAWFDLVGLFGWLVIVVALRVVVPAGRRLALGVVSRGWPTTTGRVIRSEITTAMSGTSDRSRLQYVPEIGYEYEVRGRGYSAHAVEVLAGLAFAAVGLAMTRIGDPLRGLERILGWFGGVLG